MFPFVDYATGIRDALRATANAEFGAGEPRLIEHDDHWLRPSTLSLVKEKLPAVFVALNAGQTGDDWSHHQVGTDVAYDIIFLESADRVGQLRMNATLFIQWVYKVFTGEDYPIPGFTPPDTVLLKHCIPIAFTNLTDLAELNVGLVGAKVTVEVASSSEEPE